MSLAFSIVPVLLAALVATSQLPQAKCDWGRIARKCGYCHVNGLNQPGIVAPDWKTHSLLQQAVDTKGCEDTLFQNK